MCIRDRVYVSAMFGKKFVTSLTHVVQKVAVRRRTFCNRKICAVTYKTVHTIIKKKLNLRKNSPKDEISKRLCGHFSPGKGSFLMRVPKSAES